MMDVQSIHEDEFISRSITIASATAGTCLVVFAFYYYQKNLFSYWSKRGVANPKPMPIFGNSLEFFLSDKMKLDRKRVEQFGEVHGIYERHEPCLFVADPEVIMQICIKDFDAFPNHSRLDYMNALQEAFVFALRDDRWKKVRALMTPTFTSGKIKRMFRLLDCCANDLIECFEEELPKNNNIVNIKDVYNLYTMDSIATCCYGLKLERQGASSLKAAATRNDFVENALKMFSLAHWRILMLLAMPRIVLSAFGFTVQPASSYKLFADRVTQLIEVRKNSKKKFDDYLQMILDARLEDNLELNDTNSQENHHAGLTQESQIEDQRKLMSDLKSDKSDAITECKLSDLEVLSSAMFLLVVGVETTGTLLTNASYLLAFHQDIQERLYQEIKAIAERSENKKQFMFNYESLTSCQYLDAFVSESLRRLVPFTHSDRIARRNYRIEKYNIDVPEGMKVLLGLNALMNNPKYWDDPDKFDPERFMPGNKEKIVPGTYVPFGIGPRHCIGMRFSLTEAKLALAKIVMSFRFEPAPETVFPPPVDASFGVNKLKKPLVKMIART